MPQIAKRGALLPLIFVTMTVSRACTSAPSQSTAPPEVTTMINHFEANRFLRAEEMNLVYDLRWGNFDDDSEREVLVVSMDGFRLVALDGKVKSFTAFEPGAPSRWSVRAVEFANGDKPAFVASLPEDKALVMYGWDGKTIWSVPARKYTQITVTDLDADGLPEIIAAGAGLKVYSATGKLLRTFSEEFCAAAAVLHDSKTQKPMIASVFWTPGKRADTITVFSAEGTVLQKWSPPFDFYTIGAVDVWGGIPYLMFLVGEEIWLLDAAGVQTMELSAPGAGALRVPTGQKLRTQAGAELLITVASGTGSNHKHGIFVYTGAGKLLHASDAHQNAPSLLVVDKDLPPGTVPFFLVGTRGEIWKYSEPK